MSFSEIILQGKNSEAIFDESWSQGRAGFGGLVAALVFENMLAQISDSRPLRSLQVSFVGPVTANEAFELSSQVLREGKSVTQVLGQGRQNGQVQVSMLASFGHSRDSSIDVSGQKTKFTEKPESLRSLEGLEKFVPAFTQHFDFRYCTALPFEGTDETRLRGFLRFKRAPESMTTSHLLALIDAWPPTPLPMLKSLAPASSLTWSIAFVHPQPELKPEEYCQYEASIDQASNGYGHTAAKVWNRSGELLAISHQTVTIFG